MKNTVPLVAIIILVQSVSCIEPYRSDRKPITNEILNLPKLLYLNTDSVESEISKNATTHTKTIIYYFDPDCEHCGALTKTILHSESINKFSTIFFLSIAELKKIKMFDSTNSISTTNRFIGKDIKFTFTKFVNEGSFPLLVVYSKNKKLIKIIKGNIDEQSLARMIDPNFLIKQHLAK